MEEIVLLSNRELVVTLVINDEGHARVDIQSTEHGPALTNPEDVVVILDGQGVPMTFVDANNAHADIGDWAPVAENGGSLMLRVEEFLDGWEFEADS